MTSLSLNFPKVAAAIVTYNHRVPVLKLIASLEQQNIPTFVTENNGARSTSSLKIKKAQSNTPILRNASARTIRQQALQNIPTFVTENNGADGAAEAIRKQFPQVSLLASSANLGERIRTYHKATSTCIINI
jgi:GT2 family glycosyltransferase